MVAFATTVTGLARAELSSGAAGRAWDLEHGLYTDRCEKNRITPMIEGDIVSACQTAVQSEVEALGKFTADEKKDPRIAALMKRHEQFAQEVAKLKATFDERMKKEGAASALLEVFKKDAALNSEGLWFLKTLDAGETVSAVVAEDRVEKALATKPFSDKCKTTYAGLKPSSENDEFLDNPKAACGVALRTAEILKKGLPKLVEQIRALGVSRSEEIRTALEEGNAIFVSDIPCAADFRKCGYEERIDAMSKKAGVAVGAAPAPAPATVAAAQAAMKKAVGTRRIGGFHDAAREGAVRTAAKAAKVAPLAIGLFSANDKVEKNDLGIPLRKVRGGALLVKQPNEAFCRAYDFDLVAQHAGGGSYGAFVPSDVRIDDNNVKFIVSGCK